MSVEGSGGGGDAGSLTPGRSATCCTTNRRLLWTYTLTSVNSRRPITTTGV